MAGNKANSERTSVTDHSRPRRGQARGPRWPLESARGQFRWIQVKPALTPDQYKKFPCASGTIYFEDRRFGATADIRELAGASWCPSGLAASRETMTACARFGLPETEQARFPTLRLLLKGVPPTG